MKNQVMKWDHITGYMTLGNTETLLTSRICCHETRSYILCTCNTLKTFSQYNSRLTSIQSLHGNELFHLQWSDLTCLEITEDSSMGQINILGSVSMDLDVSPWWNDTFYEENTCALTDTMDLVEQNILHVDYHLTQEQVHANLAKKTAEILCCYPQCTLCSLYRATHSAFVPSPLRLPTLQRLQE